MITNADALNELRRKNYRCAYCRESLKGHSPRELDARKIGGHWKFYHTKCYQSKNRLVHSHGKSSRLTNAEKGRQLLYSRNRKTRRFN